MKSKRILFIIGAFLFVIGICGYIGLYSQKKININQVDKQYLDTVKISTIGEQTVDKIIINQPYNNMEQLNSINGIGNVKYKTLSTIFCTYDTCRFQYYIAGILCCALAISIGALLIIYILIKKDKQKKEQEEDEINQKKAKIEKYIDK